MLTASKSHILMTNRKPKQSNEEEFPVDPEYKELVQRYFARYPHWKRTGDRKSEDAQERETIQVFLAALQSLFLELEEQEDRIERELPGIYVQWQEVEDLFMLVSAYELRKHGLVQNDN